MATNRVRRRPKDRKAQIAKASAEAFSAFGYHAVSMDAIAAKVGISAAALYRHYPSKYHLFRDAVLSLGQQLVDATAAAEAQHDDPAQALDAVVRALVDAALANRESGGLYRWEGRYLRGDDQAALLQQLRVANHRIHRPLMALRPALTTMQRWMLSSAMLSVVGSVMGHRTKLEADQIRAVLTQLGWAALQADLPSPDDAQPKPAQARPFALAGTYEALLRASMVLFAKHGYRETSMEQVSAAVGIPTSSIYRYFTGKSEMLAAALRRSADRVSGALASAWDADGDPKQVLNRLIEAYVAVSFDNPELACVYHAERVNLAPADQAFLKNVQLSTIESWARLLVEAEPNWTRPQARFVVHAAMALVVDIGRLLHYENSTHSQACVRKLMATVLGVW